MAATRATYAVRFALLALLAAGLIFALNRPLGAVPPVGKLLDPVDGFFRTARYSGLDNTATLAIPGMSAPVEVVRDERGIPHIFAENDLDAVRAFGYVVAQDRLFQLDFIPRVASGRLSEAFGEGRLEADQFLRRTGMEWGAQKNWARIEAEGGEEYDLLVAYAEGVNAYLGALEEADYPAEFRLLGYAPEPFEPMDALRVMQYMAYDLSYGNEVGASILRERLGEENYARLYPENQPYAPPIIPSERGVQPPEGPLPGILNIPISSVPDERGAWWDEARRAHESVAELHESLRGDMRMEGFREGKGSNNWAVAGSRSATGAPILAGDMHLALTLPAVWYEVHLQTPTMDTYGVAVPGAPLPVEAFNDGLAWAFTNTGSDQLDHYALELSDDGRRYRYDGAWRDLEFVADTVRFAGGDFRADTLVYSHIGPVTLPDSARRANGIGAVALRWTAHESSSTFKALIGMNRAQSYDAFQNALRDWDTPMQNILVATTGGTIGIRSTGHLPIRASRSGSGLLDGTTSATAWTGRVPFDELPHSVNPEQGFLASANQRPADSAYAYYLGENWQATYRAIRINQLLREQPLHSVDDLKRYQSDVHAVQHDRFAPLLDTLSGLAPPADTVRLVLMQWDGEADVEAIAPLAFDVFLDEIRALTWDEPAFENQRKPMLAVLLDVLANDPQSDWLDRPATSGREDASDLLRLALDRTAETMAEQYGSDPNAWRWGDHHKLYVKHITQSDALRGFWRGPYEYPGFSETLSPARDLESSYSASWRVVVDLSQSPPAGWGIYPGGPSGNPFSPLYDASVEDYAAFRYYRLEKPTTPNGLRAITARMTLTP